MMGSIQTLITDHIDVWTGADTEKKSGRGRASGNAASVYGIKKLRELILELAVRGKLVAQDASDEPANELLKSIQTAKNKLIAEGKVRKSKPLVEVGDDEIPFELPKGWMWSRLGDITNFGVTEKPNVISDNTWVLDLEDIEKDSSKLLQKIRFSERASLSDKNSFIAGDVLYGKLRPYLNKVIVADESGVCTTEIFPIRCFGSFNSYYFMYALKSPHFLDYVNARSYGMKMPRLGTEDGRKACFPLPPLAEQHRIVAKVDELMGFCDQLENQHTDAITAHEKLVSYLLHTLTHSQDAADFNENWQRIAANFEMLFTTESSIDALKQTLLQLAVMGKLVPQDASDEPASELLKCIQAEKAKLVAEGKIKKSKPMAEIGDEEKLFELPQGWEWTRLGSISELKGGMAYQSGMFINSSKNQVIRMGNVRPWKLRLDEKAVFIDDSLASVTMEYSLQIDDIVITMTGTIGKRDYVYSARVCESDLKHKKLFLNQRLCVVNSYLVASSYLDIVLKDDRLLDLIFASGTGTANQSNISMASLNLWTLPLPPLAEQNRIVAKVDELMVLCDTLKSRITAANQLQQKIADVMVEQAVA